MKEQPAERLWTALKRNAACEKGEVTFKQAVDRVRLLAIAETGNELPADALKFFASEYAEMVRDRLP
ncbi:MAG TPA: hypothetical protein VFA29_07645 [Candidatus Baltobacteraceae bacterium]|nr:hypothetical protein [Candidatus Baltobacteraceae bacterium]